MVLHRVTLAVLLAVTAIIAPSAPQALASEFSVANDTELVTALSNAVDGDTITLANDIVIAATRTITTGVTLNGNGHTLTVPEPGLTAAGTFNPSASSFNALTVNASGKTVTLTDLTVIGGSSGTQGNGIRLTAGTLIGSELVITQSRGTSGGGGLYVGSGTKARLTDSVVYRNSGRYGGGFLNQGTLILERSTFSENRSESTSGGGGAGENKFSGVLYIINSTFSNNQSTEIGGAINNYLATMYVAASTFTGNVAYGSYGGGAIGQNGGSVTVVSSLFAYNYRRTSGSVSSPTAFELDDLQPYSGTPSVQYSVLHRDSPTISGSHNADYDGAADGSDDSLFAGGSTGRITNGDGDFIGTAEIYRPAVVQDGSLRASPLATNTALSLAANRGTSVRVDTDLASPGVSYLDRAASPTAWTNIVGTTAEADALTTDQFGNTRSDPPYAGAVEQQSAALATVVVRKVPNGSVSGGSIFGDAYPVGTDITLVALPDSGYTLNEWRDGDGTAIGNTGVLTLTINDDITLEPSFVAVPSGYYQITYAGNGATTAAPDSVTTNTDSTIAPQGAMVRTGFDFVNWNTRPNGSGTTYAVNDTYTAGSSLTLYAQWTPTVATVPATPSTPTLTVADDDVTITWTAPTDGGSAITGYLVETSSDGGATWTTAAGACAAAQTSTATSCSINDVPRGTDLQVRLSAINAIGTSAPSPVGQVTVSTTTTTTPASSTTSTTVPTTNSPTTTASTSTTVATTVGPIVVTEDEVRAFPTGQLTLNGPAVAGATLTVTGTGLIPNTSAEVLLFSDPVRLGRAVTDASGSLSLSITIPASFSGPHTLAVVQYDPATDTTSGQRLEINVVEASLPVTGNSTSPTNIVIVTIALGLMTGLVVRRRATTAPH